MTKAKKINPLVREVLIAVKTKKRNRLIIITGSAKEKSGTGKSYTALKLAEEIDPTFNKDVLEERLVKWPSDFFRIINNPKLKKGMVIIIDEAGTSMAAREWYTFNNKAINYILQTFRYKQLVVIFTVPTIDYIDAQARKMFNYLIEALDIDFNKKQNVIKIWSLEYNARFKKVYYKYLKHEGNRVVLFRLNRASLPLVKKYEKIIRKFKEDLSKKYEREMRVIEEDKEATERDRLFNFEIARDEVLDNLDMFTTTWGNKLRVNQFTLQNHFKIGSNKAIRLKQIVETKMKELNIEITD